MHYVISDVHGCYDLFLALLEKIRLSAQDTLFFLGDAADRGPDGIAVIQDLMRRPNVLCLLGNHEFMFRNVAHGYCTAPGEEERGDFERIFRNWTVRNGGLVTWEAYLRLPIPQQREILTWLDSLPPYYEIVLNGRAFLLAHAGVGVYAPEKDPADCVLHDFIWERMDYSRTYYQNKLLVTGHTPTFFIDPDSSGLILQRNNHIAVDCGAVYRGSLGCLCLESLETFYATAEKNVFR